MYSSSARTECNDTFGIAYKAFKVFLETVYIRSKWYNPVGVKGILNVFHFIATHVCKTKINPFSFHILKVILAHCYT